MSLTGGATCRGCVNTGRNVFSGEYCGCPYGQRLRAQEEGRHGMTEQELAAIRARLAAAIEGPWKYRHYDDGPRVELRDHPEVTVARVTVPLHPTARFIAAAPADVAALLAEVERLRAFVRVFVKREEGLAPDVGDSMMYNRARALLGESPNP